MPGGARWPSSSGTGDLTVALTGAASRADGGGMDSRPLRAVAALVATVLTGGPLLLAAGDRASGGGLSADTPRITAAERDATARFSAGVPAGDRAWIEAAVAAARPEAQRLIGEV